LLAFNEVNAAAGRTGGMFAIDSAAALDPEVAAAQLEGREFIFDVQGHFVDPNGKWATEDPSRGEGFKFAEKTGCPLSERPGENSHLDCIGPDEFVKDIFLDSDTDMMVLSFVPSSRENEPLTIEEADATRRIVANLEGNHRLMLHGRVNPNQEGDLEAMDELKERWNVCGWKTYTQYGPGGKGFFLTDEDNGIPFIEKARELGVKIICVHKGLPFGPQSYEHSQCHDIGVVAKRYPDVDFLVYHSGFVAGKPERAYEGEGSGDGIDTLLKSLIDNGVKPNSNVYAELGSTWRFLMRDPDSAAHAMGKLFRYCGEKNVLWGTDSIWYGSPQGQIEAFRAFQIPPEYQDRFGYPALTDEVKRKVLAGNSLALYDVEAPTDACEFTREELEEVRLALAPRPSSYGPETVRAVRAHVREHGWV
jgi:hypothetical protein